jgi:hypothetical protein
VLLDRRVEYSGQAYDRVINLNQLIQRLRPGTGPRRVAP